MYLVDFKTFDIFCEARDLYQNETPITRKPPFILEFKKNDVLMAKIEMANLQEYRFMRIYKTAQKQKNKYWIRGAEWETINGVQIQELKT